MAVWGLREATPCNPCHQQKPLEGDPAWCPQMPLSREARPRPHGSQRGRAPWSPGPRRRFPPGLCLPGALWSVFVFSKGTTPQILKVLTNCYSFFHILGQM